MTARRRVCATGPTGASFTLDMSDWDVLIPNEKDQLQVAVKIVRALQDAGCEARLEEATTPRWVTVGGPS